MEAKDKKFIEYFEGHDKRFIIPVYQRSYEWGKEECSTLIDDIVNIKNNGFHEYFMGSIVAVSDSYDLIIIDGQQRLITLTLFLASLYELLSSGRCQSQNIRLAERIREYLEDKYAVGDLRMRLKAIKSDNNALKKIILNKNDNDNEAKNSNITQNFEFIKKEILYHIQKNNMTIDSFWEAFRNLRIVEIKLHLPQDNPQLIFESLNATGRKLEQADLIRNYILMNVNAIEQERLYDDYWFYIERNSLKNVTEFIRYYLTFKNGEAPNKDNIYSAFKKYMAKNENIEKSDILQDMLNYSKIYRQIIDCTTKSKKINNVLKNIDILKFGTSYPFLFDIIMRYENGFLNEFYTVKILELLESFYVRRIICNLKTSSHNKIFANFSKKMKIQEGETQENYYEKVINQFIDLKGNNRFPKNVEFLSSFKSCNFYSLKAKSFLLNRIENFNNKEAVDIINRMEDSINPITIEHIMPQKLTSRWESDLGSDFKNIHETYLHTIGNLTLTGYNSEYSNKPFYMKKDAEKGFNDSKYWLNSILKNVNSWNKDEIEKRAEIIAQKACALWVFTEIDRDNSLTQENENIVLYLDDDFTNKKPIYFMLKDKENYVDSWINLFKEVVEKFYYDNPTKLERLIESRILPTSFSLEKSHLRRPVEIADKIYIEGNMSANNIRDSLNKLFEEMHADKDMFEIYANIS